MNIALCDDDGRFRAQTARSLADILEKRGARAEVAKFRDAESLLKAVEGGAEFDLYLLDVVMPGMDGVELARRLRETAPDAPMLFFTTSKDYAVEAFALGAAHYVVKPFTREQFVAAIDRALALLPKQSADGAAFKTAAGVRFVRFRDIVYSETDEHYQLVRVAGGMEFVTRMTAQELWQKLGHTGLFARAGLRYVINLACVSGVKRGVVTLNDGRELTIPRRSVGEVTDAYLRFCCR